MAHNFLCISSYFKGEEFITACHELGIDVYLVTSESLNTEPWPRHALKDIFFMKESKPFKWNKDHLTEGLAYLLRHTKIDRIVALDDFDVEKAAYLRELFRIPGMGQTTHRYFRDKLAMRIKAHDEKINVPSFSSIFNDDNVRRYIHTTKPPWVLKPRSEASATGIQKIHSEDQLWDALEKLESKRHEYLLEQFRPGDVYHVDSLTFGGNVLFTSASHYLQTPMSVAHEGGVFKTLTLDTKDEDYKSLYFLNENLLQKFGLINGASHSEFIKDEKGEWLFLETSSRVGGAFISNKIKFATGIDIWAEWAKIELSAMLQEEYTLPDFNRYIGGLIVALVNSKRPDLSFVEMDENIQAINKDFHIALMIRDSESSKVRKKMEQYASYIANHILQVLPQSDHHTN